MDTPPESYMGIAVEDGDCILWTPILNLMGLVAALNPKSQDPPLLSINACRSSKAISPRKAGKTNPQEGPGRAGLGIRI